MENYKILERIGEGAHGQVVRATERSSGKTVAIKCVRSSDRASKNLLREIESLTALDSENVGWPIPVSREYPAIGQENPQEGISQLPEAIFYT